MCRMVCGNVDAPTAMVKVREASCERPYLPAWLTSLPACHACTSRTAPFRGSCQRVAQPMTRFQVSYHILHMHFCFLRHIHSLYVSCRPAPTLLLACHLCSLHSATPGIHRVLLIHPKTYSTVVLIRPHLVTCLWHAVLLRVLGSRPQ